MKPVEIICQRCGVALVKERDDDLGFILRCLLCSRPHSLNGELIIPKVASGRVNNRGRGFKSPRCYHGGKHESA